MDSFAITPSHSAGHSAAAHGVDNDRKTRIGFFLYVLTDVTFVIFLLVSYIWLRAYNTNGGWFPFKHMRLPDQTTSNVLLALIVLSAVFYFVAYRGARSNNQLLLRAGLAIATILLAACFVEQIRFMGQQQFGPLDGSFASMFILLSGYHIYHMAIGLFLGLGLTNRAFHGRYNSTSFLALDTAGYFWYWMALTPVLVAIMMALLPAKI